MKHCTLLILLTFVALAACEAKPADDSAASGSASTPPPETSGPGTSKPLPDAAQAEPPPKTDANPSGLVVVVSPHDVGQTVLRYQAALKDKGLTLFSRVEHHTGAKRVGLELPPSILLAFGNPKMGTVLMQANPTAGIDLPLRTLVYQGADGKTRLAYNDPAYLTQRHNITDSQALVDQATGVLEALAEAAIAP